MKIKFVRDYVDVVHEKFPMIDKKEINKILTYGFKMFYKVNLSGADVLIKEPRYLKLWMYTGRLFKTYEHYYKYSIKKNGIKLRLKNIWKKIPWDGYYYFGMTDEMYRFYESQEDSDVKIFENILMFRLFDELKTHHQYKYYFKIPMDHYKGYKFFLENYEASNAELIQ